MKSDYIRKLYEAGTKEEQEEIVESIKKIGTPIVESIDGSTTEVLLTLLWFGDDDTKTVAVFGELFGTDTEETVLTRVNKSHIWYRTYRVPIDTRSLYVFVINEDLEIDLEENDVRLDPYNPLVNKVVYDEDFPEEACVMFEEESMVQLPGFIEPEWMSGSNEGNQSVDLVYEEDGSISEGRRVWHYKGGHSKAKTLIVFIDGFEYLYETKALNCIRHLQDHSSVKRIDAVFIDSRADRMRSLCFNESFEEWLYSYIKSMTYDDVVIVGFSLGGLLAFRMAARYPDIFAKVLSQSGALYYADDTIATSQSILEMYKKIHHKKGKYFISIGQLEAEFPDHYKANRDMVELLKKLNCEVGFLEHSCGHTNYDVQLTLEEGLKYLLCLD